MTTQEENKELREKISKYEQLLEEMMEGPYISGTITSKSALNMYRVASLKIGCLMFKRDGYDIF